MRKGLLASTVFALSSAVAWAQVPAPMPTSPVPPATAPAPGAVPPPAMSTGTTVAEAPTVYYSETLSQPLENGLGATTWGSIDYLLWFAKGAPQNSLLVTTGDPAVGIPLVGAINQPSTRVLYGGTPVNFGAFSGLRATLGAWLDNDSNIGIEGSAFFLQRRESSFSAASDLNGFPVIAYPVFNVAAAREGALALSSPIDGFSGSTSITSTLQLWGAEANGVFNITRRTGVEASFLAGFRYLDLSENLNIFSRSHDAVANATTDYQDQFNTRNQFYGPQIGTRVTWRSDRFSFQLDGKIALGVTHQTLNVSGNAVQFGPGAVAPTGPFPYGFFTSPSNVGTRTDNDFGAIPSIAAKIGYEITPRLRGTVGYDFIYWNRVVRPGDQIDRNINPTQSPVFTQPPALVGPALPGQLFNRTDFFAQGVSFGLEYRY